VKVIRHAGRLDRAGGTAVVVVHDPPDVVRSTMLSDISCPFPVLVDEERQAYRAWGLPRASFARIWLDPNVWRQYARLLSAGERLRGLGRDPRQLGGDFVIDRDGRVAYARPQQRDDRPPVGQLITVVERLG
jgi:peroxiredoxin